MKFCVFDIIKKNQSSMITFYPHKNTCRKYIIYYIFFLYIYIYICVCLSLSKIDIFWDNYNLIYLSIISIYASSHKNININKNLRKSSAIFLNNESMTYIFGCNVVTHHLNSVLSLSKFWNIFFNWRVTYN